jgi:hypothetical protein
MWPIDEVDNLKACHLGDCQNQPNAQALLQANATVNEQLMQTSCDQFPS